MTQKLAQTLKESILVKTAKIRDLHENGADGIFVCNALSKMVDDLVISLLEQETGDFAGSVVAQGGYGRGLLNPYSDIDLLFLREDRALGKNTEPPHETLALLWDIGFKVGHAARTVSDTVAVGLADLTARTAMIESRLLGGAPELYNRFRKKYRREVIRYRPNVFIQAKIDEMERRRHAYGRFAKLTEPNIKESPGGLRDFHTAIWCLKSKLDFDTLDDLVSHGISTKNEIAKVTDAHSFMLRLRNALHWHVDRDEDTLSHTYQTEIARNNGFGDDESDNIVCANLMAQYFMASQVIKRFADDMATQALDYRRRWRLRPIYKDPDGLFSDRGRLFAHSFPPAVYGDQPTILFNIARRLSEEGLTVAPNLYRGLEKIAREGPDKWFAGDDAGRLLMSTLKLPHASIALSLFYDTGILTRLIPEFADISDLSQFDLFHRYAVDQHILGAVMKFEDIPHGATVNEWMKDVWRAQPDLEIIKLALLLHDLGKRAIDRHLVEEDNRTEAILARLGLDNLTEDIGFLVDEHVFMSNTAQRLDFADPATLKSFCSVVKNRVNLRRLYLLTYADIAAVGPGIWNEWKDKLLYDLYDQADRFFIEGEAYFLSFDERLEALIKPAIAISDAPISHDEVADFLVRAPERYLANALPITIASDMALTARLADMEVASRFDVNQGDATGRLTLAAPDTIGLISTVTGALVAKNIGVVGAQIHSFKGRLALDSFVVEGPGIALFYDNESVARFERELAEALAGKRDVNEMVLRYTRFMGPEKTVGAHPFEPHVAILNNLSDDHSIIEVWAPDRVGLLYDITRVMAKLRIDISSAKISTEGPKAINVFYVLSEHGKKIGDPAYQRTVESAIVAAIKSPAGVD